MKERKTEGSLMIAQVCVLNSPKDYRVADDRSWINQISDTAAFRPNCRSIFVDRFFFLLLSHGLALFFQFPVLLFFSPLSIALIVCFWKRFCLKCFVFILVISQRSQQIHIWILLQLPSPSLPLRLIL